MKISHLFGDTRHPAFRFPLCACFLSLVPANPPASESFPKPDLEVEYVAAGTELSGRSLLVLRHKREPIRNAIFDGQYLIGIGRDVRRISNRQFLTDPFSQRQTRARSQSGTSTEYRIDFKAA